LIDHIQAQWALKSISLLIKISRTIFFFSSLQILIFWVLAVKFAKMASSVFLSSFSSSSSLQLCSSFHGEYLAPSRCFLGAPVTSSSLSLSGLSFLLVTVSSFALFVIQLLLRFSLEDIEIIGHLIGNFETFSVVPILNVV